MFLLKRRKDGKFWNNSGRRHGDAWVDDPSTCRPFRSIGAVRHSRACYGIHPSWNEPPRGVPWTDAYRKNYYAKSAAWHAASNAAGRKDYFESLFEIVPVQVKVVLP